MGLGLFDLVFDDEGFASKHKRKKLVHKEEVNNFYQGEQVVLLFIFRVKRPDILRKKDLH